MDSLRNPDSIKPAESGRLILADDLDRLSRDELERTQQHNFAAMVAAALRTPAVRERWPGLDEVREVNDLAKLPLLSPAELAVGCPPHSREFVLQGDGPGLVLRSSGTSGKAKMMFYSWQGEQQTNHLGARGLRSALRGKDKPCMRVANCMHPGELNGAFFFVHGVCRHLPALTFPLGSRTPIAETVDLIAQHGIDTLVATPAYGIELVTSVPGEQLASLRNLFYLGAALSAERRRTLSEAAQWINVASLAYSTNETGPIGYQCAHLGGSTHHVHEDGVLVEIVDEETGEPVPDGTAGELVVTRMTETGMAAFRYRIGDLGYVERRTCACGSAAKMITLIGRTAQSLNVDAWTISSDHLMSGLAELGITDPADCQLQVLWDFSSYRVRLLLSPRTPPGITADAVAASMRDKFHMNKVLTSSRCSAFTVERTDIGQFASTDRGKVPVLYQRDQAHTGHLGIG
jgi:phenylacetate-CoA ligase